MAIREGNNVSNCTLRVGAGVTRLEERRRRAPDKARGPGAEMQGNEKGDQLER